jgi:hypothetical protein
VHGIIGAHADVGARTFEPIKIAAEIAKPAQIAVRDPLPGVAGERMLAKVVADLEDAIAAGQHGRELLGLVDPQGQRLLDEHVLARLDRGDAEVDVLRGGGHDVDQSHMVERRPPVGHHPLGRQVRCGPAARGGIRVGDPQIRLQAAPGFQMGRAEAAKAHLQD